MKTKFYLTLTCIIALTLFVLSDGFAQAARQRAYGHAVNSVAFSPTDPTLVVSGHEDGIIRLWDLGNDSVRMFRGHTERVNIVVFSLNRDWLFSGSDDRTARSWEVSTQQNLETLNHIVDGTRFQVKDFAFSPDETSFAVAGGDVTLWRSEADIAIFQHDGYAQALAYSPDSERLATGDNHGIVTIWDVQRQEQLVRLRADSKWISTVKFSPDGSLLATAGYDGEIRLWDTSSWRSPGILEGHGTTYDLDFSPDGRLLATTGYGVVDLWRLGNGKKIASFSGHTGWVRSVDFSPDGQHLVSGGSDGSVRVEPLAPVLQAGVLENEVRVIYFLPKDRTAQPDIDAKLDSQIKRAQKFFADAMQRHGYGRKTFRFETDTLGNAVVHRIDGKFNDTHYHTNTTRRVIEEAREIFDTSKNIYLLAVDISERVLLFDADGKTRGACGQGTNQGDGGYGVVPAHGGCFVGTTPIHELGHAFGLDHDFRNNAYIMSYGNAPNTLSPSHAEWLNAHPYFNPQTTINTGFTDIRLVDVERSHHNRIQLHFDIDDADGLHQTLLLLESTRADASRGFPSVVSSVSGQGVHASRTVFSSTELTALTALTDGHTAGLWLHVMDKQGNHRKEWFYIDIPEADKPPLYWANFEDPGIARLVYANPNTGSQKTLLTQQDVFFHSLVMNTAGNKLFWVTTDGGDFPEKSTLMSAALDGGNPREVFRARETILYHLTVDTVTGNLYWATWNPDDTSDLMVADPNGSNARRLFRSQGSINSFAVDSSGGNLYWAEFDDTAARDPSKLQRSDLNGGNRRTLFTTQSLYNLVLDSRRQKIYYLTSTEDQRPHLNAADTNGGNRQVLFTRPNGAFHNLVLNATDSRLYWIFDDYSRRTHRNDRSAIRRLQRANLNGQNVETLRNISTDLHPDYLSATIILGLEKLIVDSVGEKLYWNEFEDAEAGRQYKLQRSDLNGRNIQTLIREAYGISTFAVDILTADGGRPVSPHADVNQDGKVNQADLLLVVSALGESPPSNRRTDVNRDGRVTIEDCLRVVAALDNPTTAAAPLRDANLPSLNLETLRTHLNLLHQQNDGSLKYQLTIVFFENLIAAARPKKTALLANYPNPFNPETWIPYQLAAPAAVEITIYAGDGQIVRALSLGHQPAGIYESRSRAVYWDGRNEVGETVASGVYFYTLTAGDFTATRKLLIRK